QRLLAHLQREEGDRLLRADGRVLRDVEGERRLPHGGTGGDDDQVAPLETRGEVVQVGEAGRYAGDRRTRLRQDLDLLHRRPEQLLDPYEAAPFVGLRDLE